MAEPTALPHVENSREGIPLLISPEATHDPIRPATGTEIQLADRVADLEEALVSAQQLVGFMHSCLMTRGSFRYAHPEMTETMLAEWRELAPVPPSCVHSVPAPGCESCVARARRLKLHAERAERNTNSR